MNDMAHSELQRSAGGDALSVGSCQIIVVIKRLPSGKSCGTISNLRLEMFLLH